MERPTAEGSFDLPVYASRFVGRRRDVAEVAGRLSRMRLVTLVGAAGAGKTRLALEVARQTERSWPDGARLVELAALSEASLLPEAFASAIGVAEDGLRPLVDLLIGRLAGFQGLIVVDNCEHVIESCAQLVDRILRRCPKVSVLATSREALHIDGEAVWPVPPMACPPEGASLLEARRSDAVQLFVARAQRVAPRFELNGSNAQDLAAICRRLDGLPLAIELAAARVPVLDLQSICVQLDDRFRFLTDGFRTAPPRQRTLRAAIDWSYELLTSAEQQLFERVSVFCGGFNLAAAQKVCIGGSVVEDRVLHLLDRLIAKSLVQPTDRGRYRLLESMRAYGSDRLRDAGQLEAWRLRHAQHFAAQTFVGMDGHEAHARALMAPEEVDNVREALAWSRIGDRPLHIQLAIAFGWFCCRAGYATEGRAWLEPASANNGDDRTHVALAYRILSILAWRLGDAVAAERFASEEVGLRRAEGDEAMLAGALGNLAHVRIESQRLDEATVAVREESAIAERLGHQGVLAEALFHIGCLEAQKNELERARDHLSESAALHEAHLMDSAYVNLILGWVLLMLREIDAARKTINKFTMKRWRSRDVGFLPGSLDASAEIAFLDGAPERAMRLKGAADHIRERGSARGTTWSLASRDRWVPQAERALGKAARAAWLEGRQWTVDEVVAYALAPAKEQPPRAAHLGHARLSRREVEVAELIARGLTNEEVATRLHLSRRTVEAHLEHIRTKLGARSRVDVATWVTTRSTQAIPSTP